MRRKTSWLLPTCRRVLNFELHSNKVCVPNRGRVVGLTEKVFAGSGHAWTFRASNNLGVGRGKKTCCLPLAYSLGPKTPGSYLSVLQSGMFACRSGCFACWSGIFAGRFGEIVLKPQIEQNKAASKTYALLPRKAFGSSKAKFWSMREGPGVLG